MTQTTPEPPQSLLDTVRHLVLAEDLWPTERIADALTRAGLTPRSIGSEEANELSANGGAGP